jgi:hypothetical protein
MSIKIRLAKLEASMPAIQANSFVFMTRAGSDNSKVIAFNYREKITRTENETFDHFQSRASIFFAENNPELTIFIIQCLYKIDDD